ncbi:MAG TPA: hypothetical protein VEB22_06620 [Phycisphaerales bacterium]|nr:hypothetical protein [Phycisphaerales bacterium]
MFHPVDILFSALGLADDAASGDPRRRRGALLFGLAIGVGALVGLALVLYFWLSA